MKLIVISPDDFFYNEASLLNQMFESGLKYFHYRKYNSSLEETILFFKNILPQYHNRIIIHSHFELLDEFDLKGIHLNEMNRKKGLLKSTSQLISTSFHDLTEMKENTSAFEYVFFSPVFKSISKASYRPKYTEQELKDGLKGIKNKVIALGGINDQNLKILFTIGFRCAALSGHIWQSTDPVKEFIDIQNKLKELSAEITP